MELLLRDVNLSGPGRWAMSKTEIGHLLPRRIFNSRSIYIGQGGLMHAHPCIQVCVSLRFHSSFGQHIESGL